jgi:hypothetical protein
MLHEAKTSPGFQLGRNRVQASEWSPRANWTKPWKPIPPRRVIYSIEQLAEPGLQGLQLPAGCAMQLDLAALPGMRYTVWAGPNLEGVEKGFQIASDPEGNRTPGFRWMVGPHVHCYPRVAN